MGKQPFRLELEHIRDLERAEERAEKERKRKVSK